MAIFSIAFVARAVSVYHLRFLEEPQAGTSAPSPHIRVWLSDLRASGALTFSAYFMLMNFAVAIASPLFAVYMLRDLEFSYLQFCLNSGMSVIVQFLTLNTWGRLADVFGNRLILIVTSMIIPLMPALWVLSDHFWYLLLIQCLSGLSWGGFSLSAGNMLFELLPRTQRIAYLAFHNIGAAAAVFAGAMLGALIATRAPAITPLLGDSGTTSSLLFVFVLSAVVRMLVALLGSRRIRQLRRPRRTLPPHALVLRVTGFNAFLGLLYELIGSGTDKGAGTDKGGTDKGRGRPEGRAPESE